jgi:peptide/nickel transport system permease protein
MILVELLPNLLSIIGYNFIGSVIYTIITQATLEFLGLGNPLSVSWGTMLYNAQTSSAMNVGAWWEILAPSAAIAVIGIGLSLLNFGVDEISNPRLRTLGAINAAAKAQDAIDRARRARAAGATS